MIIMKKMAVVFLLLSVFLQGIPPLALAAEEAQTEGELIFQSSELSFRCGSNGRLKTADGYCGVENGVLGAFLETEIPIEQPGIYHVYAVMMKTNKTGKIQFSVGNDNTGSVIDLYSSKSASQRVEIGYADVKKSGSQRIRFTSVGKNSSSLGYNISVKEIRFKKESVDVISESEKPGNIFIEGETPEFPMTLVNKSSSAFTAKIEYSAVSSHGYEKSFTETETFRAGEKKHKKITMPVAFKDTYQLHINIIIDELKENYQKSIPFSFMERVEESTYDALSNGIFGMCTHFSQAKGDVKINAALLKKAGVKWIRDECTWGAVEQQKKIYSIPERYDTYLNELFSQGTEVLMLLNYGNKLYDEGGAPYTEEGLQGFVDYARFMAEHFKGRIHVYEVWNEYSTGMGNPKNQPIEVYAEMLKRVYEAIKEVDPNIKVLCGGFLHPSAPAFKRVFDSVGVDYCDGISYHPYCSPQNPDTMDTHGDIESNVFLDNELMWRYGTQKPTWFTEVGWYTGTASDAVTENQHAAFMIRTYTLAMAHGVERVFYYDFQDDFANIEEREGNFGIIKTFEGVEVPYLAKQSYVAFAAMANKLAGAKFIKEYRYSNDARAQVFETPDGKEVVVMYNINGVVEASVKGNTALMQAYDMFGNPCMLEKLSAEPAYLVGEKGQFHSEEIETSQFSVLSGSVLLYREGTHEGVRNDFKGISIEHHQGHVFKGGLPSWTAGGEHIKKELAFNIDDSYVKGGIMPVKLHVTYFDEGNGGFEISYDSAKGRKSTNMLRLTNSKEWKTAVFDIEDGSYANGFDGADFLIIPEKNSEISVRYVKLVKTMGIAETEIMAELSDFMKYKNATIRFGDNPSGFVVAKKEGRSGIMTDKGLGSTFIYFNINDEILYNGSFDLEVYVDYFDEGEGHFSVVYQKAGGDQWTVSDVVKLTDSKTWKTACVKLEKAACNNRNANADFRVALWDPNNGMSPANVCFGKIEVKQHDSNGEQEKTHPVLTDIAGHWGEPLIDKMYKNNMVAGYEDHTFMPENSIRIDEFIMMLIQYMNLKTEGTADDWAGGAIQKATQLGIVRQGEIGDYTQNINRGQIALMLSRVAGGEALKNLEIYQKDIADFSNIDEKYKRAVLEAYAMGLMFGYDDGMFHPGREATRAEAVALIARL